MTIAEERFMSTVPYRLAGICDEIKELRRGSDAPFIEYTDDLGCVRVERFASSETSSPDMFRINGNPVTESVYRRVMTNVRKHILVEGAEEI